MDSEAFPANWLHPKFSRADVEIAREREIGEKSVTTFTHLEILVQGGDTALRYDTENMGNRDIFPDLSYRKSARYQEGRRAPY